MKKYNPEQIEKKWQEYWQTNGVFNTSDEGSKKYILVEFPYPSGEGLHMGHLRPYVAGDVVSRYYRMAGFHTMYPIGWDAFGLPAENFAIKKGVHPRVSTEKNIANAKRQIQSWGVGFDWAREINTTDPNYYKWTQWIFLQFYKAGLAYEATGLINWCPKDKTGLANEEVINGHCERCGTTVEKKELRQWYLKITEYAEKLLKGLDDLQEWPEAVKLQQANWIGKSTGEEIDFHLDFKVDPKLNDNRGPDGEKAHIKVFTTRPDTIYGATFLVLAPEHPWVVLATDDNHNVLENKGEVKAYVEKAKTETEIQRTVEGKEKTGVEIKGVVAINPATKQEIPIWVADYVLGNYGTGAIMAVPGHDERDAEFAKKFNLQIIELEEFSEFNRFGKAKVTYKLRDWVFSRQRYWGEPIPIVHCEKDGVVPVPEDQLPILLPEVENYEPTGTGESPLAAIDEWVNTTCPKCNGPAKRETNTMPQWAGSSWYFLRYADPHNEQEFAAQDKLRHWMPVDIYFGGMEHTTLHLLYSRFWNIFLHDQGLVPVSEPYTKRVPHGIILASDGEKMSKSRGNVVNPDDIIKQYGADTLRMYELFLGPHDATVSWSDQGIVGVARFLDRVWYWVNKAEIIEQDSEDIERALNQLIKKVTEDIEGFRFNTAVSSFMSFHNEVKDKPVTQKTIQTFLRLLYPFAPHISEELSEQLGTEGSVQNQVWPKYDELKLVSGSVKIVVQINGKVRETLEMSAGSSEDNVKTAAMASEKVQSALSGHELRKVIYVQDKLINLVI